MSYGKKYTITFREDTGTALTGNMYRVDIYKSGYVGSATTVKASDNPITLSYKKQDLISPLCGSELTIGLMSTSNGQWLEFATATPLQYYVDVLLSTNQGVSYTTYWSGVNTTDCYTEPYKVAPYPINLKFNCGLGELQWHRYENAGALVNGIESLALTLSNCLSFLPYTKNIRELINIREDTMVDTLGFLEQTCLMDLSFTEIANDGELHGINCNKLLNQILTSLGCRMYQSNNLWFVERIIERTAESIKYFDYTPATGFQNPGTSVPSIANGTLDTHVPISNSTAPKLVNGGDWAVTQKKSGLNYQFNTNAFNSVELVPNPFFEDTPTSKTATNLPTQWDFGSKYTPYIGTSHLGLATVNPYQSDEKYKFGLVMDSTLLQAFNVDCNTMETSLHTNPGTIELNYSYLNSSPFVNNWGIHAVRRTGDTYSNPWVYIDPVNGSLQININYYFRICLNPTGWNANSQNPGGDAYNLAMNPLAGIMFFSPFRLGLYDGSGNFYDVPGFGFESATSLSWVKGSLASSNGSSFSLYFFQICNNNFPDPSITGQATPLTAAQISNLLKTAYNGGVNSTSVYLNYYVKRSINLPFNTTGAYFGTTPGVYKFDLTLFPCVVAKDVHGRASDSLGSLVPYGLSQTEMNIDKFGLCTADIQYKDSFQSASGYTKFYSTPDLNNRWSEQTVKITYGDSITPGYPGSFRLTNSNPTQTWHVRGDSNPFKFDTGTSNADPGSGKMRFDNSAISSATHIYIDDVDNNSVNQTGWFAAMVTGKTLILTDNNNGVQYKFTTGTPVSHTGYYDIPVTYVSGTGSWSSLDVIEFVYIGGQALADILFNSVAGLLGVYRRAITGKILLGNGYTTGGIPFYQSVLDEDGTLYAQTGNQFDFKKAAMTINLEEVSAIPATISLNWQSATTTNIVNQSNQQSNVGISGTQSFSQVPIGQKIAIGTPNSNVTNYPTA